MRPLLLVLLLASLPILAAEPPPPPEGMRVRVTLRDGQVLRGTLVESTKDRVRLLVSDVGEVALASSAVKALEPEQPAVAGAEGEQWPADPSRTRYLYAPSAVMLGAGKVYFSQKELLFTSAAFGVTDNVTLVAGAVVPAWFVPEGRGLNLIGGIKVGAPVTPELHLAAGVESLVLPFVGTGTAVGMGFAFGTVTWDRPTFQLSLSAGRPFTFGPMGSLPEVIFVPSASWRVARNVALVTENWVMPFQPRSRVVPGGDPMKPELVTRYDGFTLINALAVRLLGERWSTDVGLVRLQQDASTLPIPVPWVDFSYHFG